MTAIKTIYGIGRNYADHAKELGNPVPSELIVFLKPLSSVTHSGTTIFIPRQSQRVDHEVEVVVQMQAGGRYLSVHEAYDKIGAIAVGIDFTARDLQSQAKQKGLPWAIAKGFPGFAAIGDWCKRPARADFDESWFWIDINGGRRQNGQPKQMLFPIDRLISELSQTFKLEAGDVVFTGTPAGVSPLSSGDSLEAVWECGPIRSELRVDIIGEEAK